MNNTPTLQLPAREAYPDFHLTPGAYAALEILPAAMRRKVITAAFEYIFNGVVPTNLSRAALAIFALIIEASACSCSDEPIAREQVEIPPKSTESKTVTPAAPKETEPVIPDTITEYPEPPVEIMPQPESEVPTAPLLSYPRLPRKLKKVRLKMTTKTRPRSLCATRQRQQ